MKVRLSSQRQGFSELDSSTTAPTWEHAGGRGGNPCVRELPCALRSEVTVGRYHQRRQIVPHKNLKIFLWCHGLWWLLVSKSSRSLY